MNQPSDAIPSVEETLRCEKISLLRLPPPPTVQKSARLREGLQRMKEHRSGTVLICDGDRLMGIFTERDVLMKLLDRQVDFRRHPALVAVVVVAVHLVSGPVVLAISA